MAAAHARAAAVLSLITSHGALLHAPLSEEAAIPNAQLAEGAERDIEPAGSQSNLMQQDDAADAAPSKEETALPPSAEQNTSTEDMASAADQYFGEPDSEVSNSAAADLQSTPPADEDISEAAQHGPHYASSAGAAEQKKASSQQAKKETPTGVAEARQHCLVVRFFPPASVSHLHATRCLLKVIVFLKCVRAHSRHVLACDSSSTHSLHKRVIHAGFGSMHQLRVSANDAAGSLASSGKPDQGSGC